ncbi:MAG: hypothetical protein IPM37_11000 [Hahellaceae bacterium]|nr:hypothetical protein [Hahellaceae bacterium]
MLNRLQYCITRSRACNALVVLLVWVFLLQPQSGMAAEPGSALPDAIHSEHCPEMTARQTGMGERDRMEECVCADHVLCVMSCPMALKFLTSPLTIVSMDARPRYPQGANAPKPWGIQSPVLRPPIS